jgi:hypothetical protein
MTYDTFMDTRSISGVPGIAVRLGRALENWGRQASVPTDREALRREHERQLGIEARMLHDERLVLQHR